MARTSSHTSPPPFTDPGADKIIYWKDADGAFKPVTIAGALTFTGGTLTGTGGGSLTVGDPIASGASTKLLYEDGSNNLAELGIGTNLSIGSGNLNASGGSATDISTRAYATGAQTFTRNVFTPVVLNAESYDTDTSHFTSDAALTGTVAWASGTTVTGSGTAFSTELSVGQVFKIPGAGAAAATAYCVVTAIGSNTSLTVASQSAPVTGVSGVTATRVSGAFVARTAGKYAMSGTAMFTASVTAVVFSSALTVNGDASVAATAVPDYNSSNAVGAGTYPVSTNVHGTYNFAQWDFVLFLIEPDTTSGDQASVAGYTHLEWHKLF